MAGQNVERVKPPRRRRRAMRAPAAQGGTSFGTPPRASWRERLALTWEPVIADTPASEAHWFWKAVLIALPVYYFVIFGRFGLGERDDGFVLAYSWRVLLGELPHRDFISVRPAMPAYVHALSLLLMPESLEMIFDRFLNYAMAAAANYFLFASLDRWIPLRRVHLNAPAMAALGFIYSVHNFPPMAWTTTDGVFFFCLGLFLLTRGPQWPWLAGGMIAVLAGLLTKQSFIAMVPAALVTVFVLYGRKAAGVAFAALVSVSLLLTMCGAALGILGPMIAQTTNTVGRGNVFYYSGLLPYFERMTYFVPLLAFALVRLAYLRWGRKVGPWAGAIGLATVLALLFEVLDNYTVPSQLFRQLGAKLTLGAIWPHYGGKSFREIWEAFTTNKAWTEGPGFNIPYHGVRSLFWLGLGAALATLQPLRVPGSVLPLYGLLLSWSCSATNGYPTPALCSGPLVFALFHAGIHVLSERCARILLHVLMWGGLAVYSFANCFPYQSKPIWRCTHPMGTIFAKASHIYADDKAWRTYSELKELAARYGPHFKTLPNVPLANYLTGTKPPIPVDWVEDYELPGEWRDVALQLDRSGAAVFVRKDLMESELLPYYAFGGINSTVTFYVTRTWKRIHTGKEFDVYQRDWSTSTPLEKAAAQRVVR